MSAARVPEAREQAERLAALASAMDAVRLAGAGLNLLETNLSAMRTCLEAAEQRLEQLERQATGHQRS